MIDLRFYPIESTMPAPKGGRWLRNQYSVTWGQLLNDLEAELKHLAATDIVVEAGFTREQIRNDGWPRGSASPTSPGVRLSFRSAKAGGERSIGVNRFAAWQQNLRAIGLVLQRLRLVAEIDPEQGQRAYAGYARLPAPQADAGFQSVEEAMQFLSQVSGMSFVDVMYLDHVYRQAARKAHPDVGGSESTMRRVNAAKGFIEANG